MSSPEPSKISPFNPTPYGRRILWLCVPSWGAALWSAILVVVAKLHVTSIQRLLLGKPILTVVSITALISPLCWIGAIVFAARSERTTRAQKLALVVSAFAIAMTWIAILRFMRRH